MTLRVLLIKAFRVVTLTYIGVLIAMFFLQPSLLFHPTPYFGKPSEFGLKDFEEVTITTSDNIKLKAWLHKSLPKNKAVIYFYGNGDSLRGYPEFFKKLVDHGYTVLGVNYRGYGGSEGSPSEEGLYEDGKAAVNFIKQFVPEKNIIVVGRSLGTGVATEMAKTFELDSIVLISPYTSIPDIGSHLYPYLPAHLIARYHFDSLKKISDISEPLLIIHGAADNFIPISNSHKLFDAAKSRKALNIYKDGDHNNIDLMQVSEDIFKFAGVK